jgi:iron uptake system EfeUOB component EfeO/EfeM
VRPAASLICAAGLLAVTGCGGGETPPSPGPSPVSARIVGPGLVARVTPADLKRPIARYLDHAASELRLMEADVSELRAAAAAGDLDGAKAAWLDADARYETIGAAYGAFGELDAAINGRPGNLESGTASKDFTGLHRIELALWAHRSTAEAEPYVAQLGADVARLRGRLPKVKVEPLDFALRAHEVLEDTLQLQLAGVASPWAGAALVALRSNIEGTEVILRSLRPLVRERNPQRMKAIDVSLDRLRAAVGQVARPDGSLPSWKALPQAQRELIDARTAAAAEQLAYVPAIADPRPIPPAQNPFGKEASQ